MEHRSTSSDGPVIITSVTRIVNHGQPKKFADQSTATELPLCLIWLISGANSKRFLASFSKKRLWPKRHFPPAAHHARNTLVLSVIRQRPTLSSFSSPIHGPKKKPNSWYNCAITSVNAPTLDDIKFPQEDHMHHWPELKRATSSTQVALFVAWPHSQ